MKRICSTCGNEVPEGAKSCIFCGTPFVEPKVELQEEQVKKQTAVNKEESKPQVKVENSNTRNTQEKKHSILIAVIIIAIFAVVGILATTGTGKKEQSIASNKTESDEIADDNKDKIITEEENANKQDPVAAPEETVTEDDGMVYFNDPALKKAVLSYLGIKGDDISKETAQEVTYLDLSGSDGHKGDIVDLTGLGEFTWLIDLDLSNNQITDVKELGKLSHLETLHLEKNRISDVSDLADLTSLKLLDLEDNYISEIDDLRDLKGLTVLDVRNNSISDIEAVRELKRLENLYIRANKIRDISPVSELTNLTYFSAGENEISDISAVSNLKRLHHLILCDNYISDMSAIMSLPRLTYLEIQNNPLTNGYLLDSLDNCEIKR